MAVKESNIKPFYTALILAFVCSFLVAAASVGLRPLQIKNSRLDQHKNILRAAGLYKKGMAVDKLFASAVEPRIIDIATGRFVPERKIDPATFNQRAAAIDPERSRALPRSIDQAGLQRLEKYSLVYLIKKNGRLSRIVFPIRGKGLWSTMYGYLALGADLNTVIGITFYENGETPGLGAEVANPAWQAGWRGKKIYRAGRVDFQVVKGGVQVKGPAALHEVDGITGATLTSNGVNNLLHFWFGKYGFKPFIDRLRQKLKRPPEVKNNV